MNCAQKLNFDACEREISWNSTDMSAETSACGMSDALSSSMECSSPAKPFGLPRRLDFSKSEDIDTPPNGSPEKNSDLTPPYKRVRALKLFDSPLTPKTILEKCSTPNPHILRARFHPPRFPAPAPAPAADTLQHPDPGEEERLREHLRPEANVNPFTPDVILLNKKKRSLSKMSTSSPANKTNGDLNMSADLNASADSDILEQPHKKLRESNIHRYYEEFVEENLLGRGTFGCVYRCKNRLDGCTYALKRSHKPVAGSVYEKTALNEVYAHAVLEKHHHVVRYYSAWTEDNHMIIQNEFCNGGSLQDVLETKGPLAEPQLLVLLAHVAGGLRYIHSKSLVHMDIKPANIFLSLEYPTDDDRPGCDSADDGFDEHDEDTTLNSEVTYKIGDLGHVTCVNSPQLEEGDCRYLSTEVLQEDLSDLTKADIFALGLTIYESAGGGPLPKNGEEWHEIRRGVLKSLSNISTDLNDLILRMIDPNPAIRPTASQILRSTLLCPSGHKTQAQLLRELEVAKLKNEVLQKKLQQASQCIKSYESARSIRGLEENGSAGVFTSRRSTRYHFGRSTSNVNF